MSGGALTAKMVITGDASGVVGAGKQASTALDGVTKSANDAGAALSNAGTQNDAAAVALKGQADAAAAASRAISSTGTARRSEIVSINDQARAGESVITKVRAMSAAHAEYNSTIAAARALRAQDILTETQYGEAVAAAAAKLAQSRATVELGAAAMATEEQAAIAVGAAFASWGDQGYKVAASAKTAKAEIRGLSEFMGALGMQTGVADQQMTLLRASVKAVPSLFAAAPILTAASVGVAAVGALVVASQSYQASIGRLNVTLQAHALAVSTTSGRYIALADDMAYVANVSTITARKIQGSFADAHIDSSQWSNMTAVAKDYAAVLGTDVDQAAAQLAQDLQKPYEFAKKLTDQYGLFDQAMLQQIRDLDQSGRMQEAQSLVTKTWGERIKGAASETSGWAKAWDSVSTAVSNAWDKIGQSLFKSDADILRMNIKSYEDQIQRLPIDRPINWEKTLEIVKRRLAVLKAQLGTITKAATDEATNREADAISGIIGNYGLSSYDQTLRRLQNERQRIEAAYKKGIVASGVDGKALTQEQALAPVDREITKTKKERADALRNLNDAEKEHYELVKRLIEGAPELIAQTRQETDTATGRVQAYLKGASALEAYNAEQEIAKSVLPYQTALTYADVASKEKLTKIIATLTAEKRKQLEADRALAAMQDIDQQIGSASGFMSTAAADAWYELTKKKNADWYNSQAANFDAATEDGQRYLEKLNLLMGRKTAEAYDQDLRNRHDWASGIERANRDIIQSQQDWATTTESFMHGWADAGEEAFVQFATTGKASLEDLADFAEQQFARMAYQKYLAASYNALGQVVLGAFDQAFSGLGSIFGLSAGTKHSGGVAGDVSVTRMVPSIIFSSAQRYHGGGRVLAENEVPIIALKNERVQTEQQAAQSDTAEEVVAILSEQQRPIIQMIAPQLSGQAGGEAPVNIQLNEAPGIKLTPKETRTANGGRRINVTAEFTRELEAHLAERLATRQGPLGPAIANTMSPMR